MSKEKQIEEMTNDLIFTSNYGTKDAVANYLIGKGWSKQSDNTVEVVRCKDCVYFEERHYEELGDIPYIKFGCKWSNYSRTPDDYCSLAKAKMKGGAEE